MKLIETGEKLETMASIDLYNIALDHPNPIVKRYIVNILHERGDKDLVKSLAINYA